MSVCFCRWFITCSSFAFIKLKFFQYYGQELKWKEKCFKYSRLVRVDKIPRKSSRQGWRQLWGVECGKFEFNSMKSRRDIKKFQFLSTFLISFIARVDLRVLDGVTCTHHRIMTRLKRAETRHDGIEKKAKVSIKLPKNSQKRFKNNFETTERKKLKSCSVDDIVGVVNFVKRWIQSNFLSFHVPPPIRRQERERFPLLKLDSLQ